MVEELQVYKWSLCKALDGLSAGRQINDILVLEPTTSAWLYDSYVNRNPACANIGQTFQNFITKLEKSQVEYDLGSENMIKDMGSVRGGKLIIGQCSYSTVVLPPLTKISIRLHPADQEIVAGGGKLWLLAPCPRWCTPDKGLTNSSQSILTGSILKMTYSRSDLKVFHIPIISITVPTGIICIIIEGLLATDRFCSLPTQACLKCFQARSGPKVQMPLNWIHDRWNKRLSNLQWRRVCKSIFWSSAAGSLLFTIPAVNKVAIISRQHLRNLMRCLQQHLWPLKG